MRRSPPAVGCRYETLTESAATAGISGWLSLVGLGVSCGCEGVVELTLSLLWLRTSEASVEAENAAVRLVGAGGHLRADLRRASYRRARLSRRALCDHGLLTSDGRIPRTSGYSASRAENDENPVS